MTEDRYTPYEQAIELYCMGWCIICIPYGKKAARIKWKKFQDRKSNYTNLCNWFHNTLRQNLAVVLGKVSHGLACRDFDTRTGYQAWADQHPNLSKTLPTVRTPHGYHVYFQGKVKGVKYLKSGEGQPVGELRGDGCYCILPPSVGEDGQRYEWVNPPTRENLLWFEPEQIELIFCNTGDSHVTERTERTEEDRRGKRKKWKQLKKNAKIEKAIVETLPTEFGTRHRRIFDFARLLKSTPEYANADPEQFKVIVKEWHRRALPKIRTKEFEETWIDFLMAWPKIKYRVGEGPIDRIFARAICSKPPKVALQKYSTHEKLQLLTALCRELQIVASNKPFFLSTRTAGKLLDTTAMTACRWLRLLVYDDILEVVHKGGTRQAVRKATRYRYIRSLKNQMFIRCDKHNG